MIQKIINWFLSFFGEKRSKPKTFKKHHISDKDIELFTALNSFRHKRGLSFLEKGFEKGFDIVAEHIRWLKTQTPDKAHWYFQNRVDYFNKKQVSECVAFGFRSGDGIVNEIGRAHV